MKAARGIVAGKLFDLQAVAVGGLLLFANVGVTVAARTLEARGVVLLGMSEGAARLVQAATSQLLSFASAWLLFFLVYWRVPGRKVHFRTAAVGATFTAAVYELLKGAFAWYATSVVDYTSAYGGLAVVAMLFFWVYYSAVVFIMGGYVARTFEVRREIASAAVHG
jgi:membrane protein